MQHLTLDQMTEIQNLDNEVCIDIVFENAEVQANLQDEDIITDAWVNGIYVENDVIYVSFIYQLNEGEADGDVTISIEELIAGDWISED